VGFYWIAIGTVFTDAMQVRSFRRAIRPLRRNRHVVVGCGFRGFPKFGVVLRLHDGAFVAQY
jgi:hypothetical protein